MDNVCSVSYSAVALSPTLVLGAINTFSLANVDWGATTVNGDASSDKTKAKVRGDIVTSLRVTNISTAVGGKDFPSVDEIKYLIKYNTSAQNRAVTVKDYKVKLMEMPPRYGAPFRSAVIENNNKIEMSFLGLDASGRLDPALPRTLVENMLKYMSHYRQINDYIEMRSGRIYNLAIGLELFVDKNYNVADVLDSVINYVYDYFSVGKHDMGEDIYIGDLERGINTLDGVLGLISLRVYNLWGGSYSVDECPLPSIVEGSACDTSTDAFTWGSGQYKQIDLEAIDNVLYNTYNAMFEIASKAANIKIKVKTR